MTRRLLATRVFDVPLLIEGEAAEAIVSALAGDFNVEPMMADAQLQSMQRPERYASINGRVAIVPIVGELVHRGSSTSTLSQLAGYSGVQNQLLKLAQSGEIDGIMLDMDTPGGEVGGIHELSDAIAEISNRMPVWAIANSKMASAGYWIGSAADRILATPYSRVGSIGVVVMHVDMSKALEKKGIVTTFIHAGKHKVDGNPFEPLGKEAKKNILASIEQTYGQFVEQVARGRRMKDEAVRATEARVFGADEALEVGLIDDISTLSKAVAGLRQAIVDRRRTTIQGLTMKTYEDGLTEGKALGRTEAQADVDKARKEGHAAGMTEGAMAERERVKSIISSDDAKGRETFAQHIAFNTSMPVFEAGAMLKAAPQAQAAQPPKAPKTPVDPKANPVAQELMDHLRQNSPKIGAEGGDGGVSEDDKETRLREIRSAQAPLSTRARDKLARA